MKFTRLIKKIASALVTLIFGSIQSVEFWQLFTRPRHWTVTAGGLFLKITVNIYFVAPENNFRICSKDRFSIGHVTLVVFYWNSVSI